MIGCGVAFERHLLSSTKIYGGVQMEEATTELRKFRVRIRGNKINLDAFEEVFILSGKNIRDVGKQVDEIMRDTSPKGRLYKYGRCQERFTSDIEPLD